MNVKKGKEVVTEKVDSIYKLTFSLNILVSMLQSHYYLGIVMRLIGEI